MSNRSADPSATVNDAETKDSGSLLITHLPLDILCIIVSFLHPLDVPKLRRVSRTFNRLLTDPLVLAPLLRGLICPEDERQDPEGSGQFDGYLMRFHNRRRGKPTRAYCLHDLDVFRADQCEASYDHQIFAYYADVGLENGNPSSDVYETFSQSAPATDIVLFHVSNRHQKNPLVRVKVQDLHPAFCTRMREYTPTLSIDYRTLVASGISDAYHRVVGIWSVHDFPKITLLRWFWLPDPLPLYGVCSNDTTIAFSDRRATQITVVNLNLDEHRNPIGTEYWTLETFTKHCTVVKLDSWATGKGIRDLHLSKSHLYVYSRVSEGCIMDIFKIMTKPNEDYLSNFDIRPTQFGNSVFHIRSVQLENWNTMFSSYISNDIVDDQLFNALRHRLDKISPSYTGKVRNGAPEEEDEAVLLTLSRAIDGQGCLPLGSVRVCARDSNTIRTNNGRENGNGTQNEQDHTNMPSVPPDCIIPGFVALMSDSEFEDAKSRSFILDDDDNAKEQGIGSVPDAYREWDLIHYNSPRPRSMRASLPIRRHGLCTAVFDDASYVPRSPSYASEGSNGVVENTITTNLELRNNPSGSRMPTMLKQTHLIRTTIEDILALPIKHYFAKQIWYSNSHKDDSSGEYGGDSSSTPAPSSASLDADSNITMGLGFNERLFELKKLRTKAFIATGLGFSSYVWQADREWLGFLCMEIKTQEDDNRFDRRTFLNSKKVKMLILRYD